MTEIEIGVGDEFLEDGELPDRVTLTVDRRDDGETATYERTDD